MCMSILNNISIASELSGLNEHTCRAYINRALEFLARYIDLDINSINVDVIITNNLNNTVNRHLAAEVTLDENINAVTLSRFQLNNCIGINKEIIIMNGNNCAELDSDSLTSILVHELVHCIDFQRIESLNNRFRIFLYPAQAGANNLTLVMNEFFRGWIEMRAFYYDEMYLCSQGGVTLQIDQGLPIHNEDRHITFFLTRLLGKRKCWMELNVHPDKIAEVTRYINQGNIDINCLRWCNFFERSFDYDCFYTLCEQLQREIMGAE